MKGTIHEMGTFAKKHCTQFISTHSHLHVLLDGDRGGAGAVLERRDGGDDSCFV